MRCRHRHNADQTSHNPIKIGIGYTVTLRGGKFSYNSEIWLDTLIYRLVIDTDLVADLITDMEFKYDGGLKGHQLYYPPDNSDGQIKIRQFFIMMFSILGGVILVLMVCGGSFLIYRR